jgi:hypothetical protein
MKRQTFRLGSVLRYYVLQKQRTEIALRQASRALREMDDEILALASAITTTVALLYGSASDLTTTGWIACYRKAESLDAQLGAARTCRQRQAEVVTQLQAQHKRWAQAEETLVTLRYGVDEANAAAATSAQQIVVDETVLRQWLQTSDE